MQPIRPTSDNGLLYTESPVPGGARTMLAAIAVGVIVAAIGIFFDIAILAAVGMTLGLFSLLLTSSLRYFSISVDQRRLTVGRDRVDLEALDRTFGARHGEDVLDQALLMSLDDPIDTARFRGKRGDVHIMGGGYGRTKNGARWVVIEHVDGTRHVIASRHADRLADVLNQALKG